MKKSDFEDMTLEKYKIAEEIASHGGCRNSDGVDCIMCPFSCTSIRDIKTVKEVLEFLELFKDEYGQDTSSSPTNYKDLDLVTEHIEDVSTHEYIEKRLENQIKIYEKIINHLLEEK